MRSIILSGTLSQLLTFEWWYLIIKVFKNMVPHGDLIVLIEQVEDERNVERL
jgi:hypothetical protein